MIPDNDYPGLLSENEIKYSKDQLNKNNYKSD